MGISLMADGGWRMADGGSGRSSLILVPSPGHATIVFVRLAQQLTSPSMPDQERSLVPAAAENLRKAIALHQAGDLGRAEQGYRAVLAAQPDSADALHYLGLLEAQRGRFPDALSLLDRALVVAPRYFDALVCRGNVQGALGRPRDALASYEAALAINGDSPIVHFNLGNAYQ